MCQRRCVRMLGSDERILTCCGSACPRTRLRDVVRRGGILASCTGRVWALGGRLAWTGPGVLQVIPGLVLRLSQERIWCERQTPRGMGDKQTALRAATAE